MDSSRKAPKLLEDMAIPVKVKLAGAWASLMLCYIYGDYFGLYKPGTLQEMLDGKMGPLGPTTQGVLLGTSIMMAIPSLMVFLSLVMKPRLNRWMNLAFGVLYTAIMLLTLPGAWVFYQFLGGIEILLTLAITWLAWRWPNGSAA